MQPKTKINNKQQNNSHNTHNSQNIEMEEHVEEFMDDLEKPCAVIIG